MYNDLKKILITRDQLEKRISELAQQLDNDYNGKDLLTVCVLKGSSIFYAELMKCMQIPLNFDFIAVSSYGSGTSSSGNVKLIKDIENSIEGRNVLIVEDIIDSGNTLFYLKKLFESRNPASVKICTLLNKPSRRKVDLTPDYCGFEIDDYFVVGFGLDYDEKYRNLPEIGVLKEEVYSK